MFDSSDTCIFSSFLGELREGNDTRPLKKRFMIHVSCFMTYKQFWAEARRFTNTNDEDIRPQKACDVGLRIRMMRSGAEAHLRACGVPASTRTYGIYRSSLMELELELELIQTQMAQKPMQRAEVGMRVRCANNSSAE